MPWVNLTTRILGKKRGLRTSAVAEPRVLSCGWLFIFLEPCVFASTLLLWRSMGVQLPGESGWVWGRFWAKLHDKTPGFGFLILKIIVKTPGSASGISPKLVFYRLFLLCKGGRLRGLWLQAGRGCQSGSPWGPPQGGGKSGRFI